MSPNEHPLPGPLAGLRPYQLAAVRAVVEQLRQVRSTLIVMATGTGKTQVFVGLASLARGRVVVLAHRDELVGQAAARIEAMTGEVPGVEKAETRSDGSERFVVASVQTLHLDRIERWPGAAPSLIVVDEAHHAPAKSYRRILDHWPEAKVLGVTATPDRTDEKAMGRVFESVAFEYGTFQAIEDGWLVEPILARVILEGVDLGSIRMVADDLHQGELEEQISEAKVLHAIAKPLLDHAGDRKTVVYMPGVQSAHELASILDGQRPGCARALDGTTPTDERRSLLAAHAAGEYQFLANCMVLTEGWDSPAVSCVAVARPTKSRSLYAQMLGRGLRPAPGKTDCLVIDYGDKSSRLSLAGPEDVLGGDMDDGTAEEAKRKPADPTDPTHILDALRKARATVRYRVERERLRRERKTSKKSGGRKVVPAREVWSLLGLDPSILARSDRFGLAPAATGQLQALARHGLDPGEVSSDCARIMLDAMASRSAARLASPAQLRLLARYGRSDPEITAAAAKDAIDQIAARGWRR